MNKIYITFETMKDAQIAQDALRGNVPFEPGSSALGMTISSANRREAREILTECKINFSMR